MADRIVLFMSSEGFTEELDSAAGDTLVLDVGGMRVDNSGDIQMVGGELYGLPATPSGATYAASKAYVDAQIGGDWQDPAQVLRCIDDTSGGAPGSPASGDAYVVDVAAGAWAAFAVGDLVEYDGQAWQLIVSQVGGFVPSGTRIVVDPNPGAGGGLAGQGNSIAVADGAGGWTFSAPSDGWAILIIGDGSYYENRAYGYDGGTTSWIQIPPSVPWANWVENDKWTASEAIALGDPVYWSGSNTVGKADASVVAKSRVIGIAAEAATSGQYIRIIHLGEAPGVIAAATANDPYYLASGGGLTATRPVGAGNRVVLMGYAINATDLFYEKVDYGRVA